MISDLPELKALESREQLLRIPSEIDVPLTDRVRRIIDTPSFRRLTQISQLGLVAQVYPAAIHNRFEHSLGVFRIALLYLQRMLHDERFRDRVTTEQARTFLLAALLHDVGHWPFCHPIEDLGLDNIPSHESFAGQFLLKGEIADHIVNDWQVKPEAVVELLTRSGNDSGSRILQSMLSGPIDIDKMDYLYRDSLHAGVPYGRNFDQQRLIGSLCLNESLDGIAITNKGKTAAEMMVFSRYVMFSEVYWHHAVRSATAMLQRAFYRLRADLKLDSLFCQTENDFKHQLRSAAERNASVAPLVDGLFGAKRRLYKRWYEISIHRSADLYEKFARQPYPRLVEISEQIAGELSKATGRSVASDEVLVDAPPAKLEVQFRVDVFYPKENLYRRLDEVSPVVKTLATQQFDDYVKSVRIFLAPELKQAVVEKGLDAESILKSL